MIKSIVYCNNGQICCRIENKLTVKQCLSVWSVSSEFTHKRPIHKYSRMFGYGGHKQSTYSMYIYNIKFKLKRETSFSDLWIYLYLPSTTFCAFIYLVLKPSLMPQHLCIAIGTWGEKMKTKTPGERNMTFVFGSRERS